MNLCAFLTAVTIICFYFVSQDNLCKNCKRPGHYARECPNVAVCHNCSLPGYGIHFLFLLSCAFNYSMVYLLRTIIVWFHVVKHDVGNDWGRVEFCFFAKFGPFMITVPFQFSFQLHFLS